MNTTTRFSPVAYLVVALAAATAVSACVGKYKSDFSVVVVNRAANTIQVLANGNELGQVATGQTGSFKIVLAESNLNEFTNGVAPTPQGQVILSAKDVKTGVLSTTQSLTLSQNAPVYVTFSAADFPVSTPTVARFTFSPPTPGLNQPVAFTAASSTSSNGVFAWDFGDGETGSGVTVTHPYTRAGTFTITVTVTSDNGQSSSASRPVTVSTTLPPNAASFTFSPTAPGVNQDVFFNASTSTVSGGSFTWDFGDGTTGAGVTVTHKFSRAGTFAVNLRVTNNVGQSAATARNVSVSATSPTVVANFTFSPTTPGINQDVFFNASASTPSNATYAWNFGDGSTGSGVTPTHSYARAGTYGVSLTVSNDIGQSSTTSRTITVSATGPPGAIAAIFAFSPTIPGVNQEVFFDAAASRPPDGTFTWDFGDGARGSGVTPTHRFAQAGQYRVTMTVANAFGQSATTTQMINVSVVSVQVFASFTFSPTPPGINQEVFFNASASRPIDGTFTWSFGDGSPSGSGVTPTHRFAQAGTFTVTLTVTSNGQSSSTTRPVIVSAASGVVPSFTFSPASPAVGQGVFFNGSASTSAPGTTVASYAWDFGDGTAGTGVTTTKTFAGAGAFVVRLTVTDSNGGTGTTTQSVTVAAPVGPTASFSFSPMSPTTGQTVFVNGSASTSATGTTITAYAWDFGDGTTGTGVSTTKTYAGAGTFVVRLTVTDSNGRTGTTTQNVTVAAPVSPTAAFSFSPASPTTSQTVFVNGSGSTSATGTTITSYAWDFGDGTIGTGATTTKTYANAGTFVVRLTVTDSNGRIGTTTQNVTVAPIVLVADFTFSPTNPDISDGTNAVIFDATPSSAGVTTWTWDFGDGATGTGQRVTRTFTLTGTRVVRLTVSDAGGRTATTTKNVTITP